MPRFQVVNAKIMEGTAKASGKPYKMLIASGIYTADDGVMEVGEVVFMEGAGRPLPQIVAGQAYTPMLGARSRDGKLSFEIVQLSPVAAGSAKLAAASGA
jgi:hypothetical protein